MIYRVVALSSSRFIVTGTGRSGTRYVAFLLASLGINVGHEQVWGSGHPWDAEWGDLDGEVGWEAAAHLEGFTGPIVHVTRNPLAVINSRVLTGWYQGQPSGNPHKDELIAFSDELVAWSEGETNVERAVLHWIRWCEMVDRNADAVFRLESLTTVEMVQELLGAVGRQRRQDHWVDFSLRALSRTTNQHVPEQRVTWHDVREYTSPDLVETLTAMAKDYGYEPS